MTTITIERAVLLRALEALRPATAPNGAKRDAAFEELRAALAAPATAQAAEIERLKTESEERLQNCAALVAEVERLRAAPATAPERKPMTPEQIETMWPSPEGTNSIHALVRAVEAFHGIKETP